ncbi:VOC family protein [Polymorphospora lycopeni]|uniref:VOC family protein n=1 Tax=Polymorphospora lycopeni TaxID=3140240 RepID=A0ABV5CMF6_9ACTN
MAVKFDFIGLLVADMGRSLAFYRRLGLGIPAAADTEQHVEVTLDGGFRLAWDTEEVARQIDPGFTPPPARAGRISLAFRCDSPADVDRVHAELTASGHESHREPWDAFWGQRYAIVYDPDGNSVDLYAALG